MNRISLCTSPKSSDAHGTEKIRLVSATLPDCTYCQHFYSALYLHNSFRLFTLRFCWSSASHGTFMTWHSSNPFQITIPAIREWPFTERTSKGVYWMMVIPPDLGSWRSLAARLPARNPSTISLYCGNYSLARWNSFRSCFWGSQFLWGIEKLDFED